MKNNQAIGLFDHYFEDYIFSDIEKGIKAGANYMVAQALFSYIELLGGFIAGQLGVKGTGGSAFLAAIGYFPESYMELNARLKIERSDGSVELGLYAIVRCGLIHEYSPKVSTFVANNPEGGSNPEHIGVALRDQEPRLVIYNNELFRDFQYAVQKVQSLLDLGDVDLTTNVQKAFNRVTADKISDS